MEVGKMPRRKKEPTQAEAPELATPAEAMTKLILDRMEAQESQRKMEMEALQQMLLSTGEKNEARFRRLQQEVKAIKKNAAEGEAALLEKLKAVMSTQMLTLAEANDRLSASIRDAPVRMAQRKAQFKADLEQMPTGTIMSTEQKPVKFTINGIPRTIVFGENKNVPAVYIEAWERRQAMRQQAAQLEEALHVAKDANVYQTTIGGVPIWDQDLGRVIL